MKLKPYLQFVRIGFRNATAYRLDALMNFGTSILYLLMVYYIWNAIAASGTLNTTLTEVLTYLVLAQVVQSTASASIESDIGDKIRDGSIVNELKRPVSLHGQIYGEQFGQMIFNFLTVGIPVTLIGFTLLNFSLPSLVNSAGFFISLFLSFNLVFALSYMMSMLVFWTKVGWSMRSVRTTVQGLLSGAMFPLYLLPENLKPVFFATPFPSMVNTPVEIFRMETQGFLILEVFGQQIIWIIVISVITYLLWRRAKKKLTVQGG